MPVPEAPALQAKIDFQIRIVPADGTRATNWKKRRLRYVAVFGQLSDKPLLASTCVHGVPEPKHNGVARKYPLHGTRLCRHQLNFAHVPVVHARHLAIAPGDHDRIPTCFGDNTAISGIASPINPAAFREALRFVDCHCCATARSITGPSTNAKSPGECASSQLCPSPISTSRRMARHSELSSLSFATLSWSSRELFIRYSN